MCTFLFCYWEPSACHAKPLLQAQVWAGTTTVPIPNRWMVLGRCVPSLFFFFFFIKRILRWDKSLITTSPCLRSTRFWQVDMICLSQCRWPAVSEITSQDHSPTWHPAAPGLAAAAWRGISSPCPPHVVLRMGKLMFRFHARLLPKIIQKFLLQ